MIDIKKLIEAGVQFGHQTWRWNPRMERYIWGKKNGVHLIDVSKTAFQLEKAARFLEEVASEGKQVLFVGTKKAAQGAIQQTAEKLHSPYASKRWVGGTLSNFSQVKKSVTKLLHFEDVSTKSDKMDYTKKELAGFQKIVDRLKNNVGGIRNLSWPIGALVVIDSKKEATAIKEAVAVGIPVVALVDTNSDPAGVAIVIPGNDDVARSINVIMEVLEEAVARGIAKAQERKVAPAQQELDAQPGVEQMLEEGMLEEVEEGGIDSEGRRSRPRKVPNKSEGGLIVEAPRQARRPFVRPPRGVASREGGAAEGSSNFQSPRPPYQGPREGGSEAGSSRPPYRGPREGGENRGSYGPRPPYQGPREGGSEAGSSRPPYRGPREGGENRGSYGPRPPYQGPREGGSEAGSSRPPYRGPREGGENRGSYGPRPPYRGPREGGEAGSSRPPYQGPREGGSEAGSSRPPYRGPREGGENRGSYGPRPPYRGPREGGSEAGSSRPPYRGPREGGDNRGSYGPRRYDNRDSAAPRSAESAQAAAPVKRAEEQGDAKSGNSDTKE